MLIDLLSRYEAGDVDPLVPPEMLETLMDVVSATNEAPESLTLAVERVLGDGGN